jgi:hypothetical protein
MQPIPVVVARVLQLADSINDIVPSRLPFSAANCYNPPALRLGRGTSLPHFAGLFCVGGCEDGDFFRPINLKESQ